MTTSWVSVVVLVFFLVACLVHSLSVNVTRSEQDLISISPWDCSSCAKFKQATCSLSKTRCQCPKIYSTFLMHNKTCVSSSGLVKENKCLSRKGGKANSLDVVDLASSLSTHEYQHPRDLNCTLRTRAFCYLRQDADWECPDLTGLHAFRVSSHVTDGTKRLTLYVSGSSDLESYSGRIIRVELSCNVSSTETGEKKSCILLKARGTLAGKFVVTTESPSHVTSTPINKESNPEETDTTLTSVSTLITNNSSQTRWVSNQHSISPTTKVRQTKINGAVSIDDEEDNDEVIVATISVVGAIVCVLIICVFAWLVIRHRHRSRRIDETNTPTGTAAGNANSQGVIPLSRVNHVSDPLYSELPDIIECINSNGLLTSSTPTLTEIDGECFIERNPAQYNTMPKARQNTDPLPLPPRRPRPKTPEPRVAYQTNTLANTTNTAKFLNEVNRKCMSLDRFSNKPRERSLTDVDLMDDVFCQDFHGFEMCGEESHTAHDDEDEIREKRTESFYEDLCSRDRTISVYESLQNATKESPNTRFSTLERIKQQSHHNNDGLNLQEELEPEYHILEPSTNDDLATTSSDNPAFDPRDLPDNGEDCLDWHEHHRLEGENQTNLNDEPQTLEKEGLSDKDIILTQRELRRSVSDTRLNSKDLCDRNSSVNKEALLVKRDLRPRSQSFHG